MLRLSGWIKLQDIKREQTPVTKLTVDTLVEQLELSESIENVAVRRLCRGSKRVLNANPKLRKPVFDGDGKNWLQTRQTLSH